MKRLLTISASAIALAAVIATPAMAYEELEMAPKVEGGGFIGLGLFSNTMNQALILNMDFDYSEIKAPDTLLTIADVQIDTAAAKKDKEAGPQKTKKVEEGTSGSYTQAEINEMINNPLGKLWILMVQNDYISYGGDILDDNNIDNINQNTTLIQPVMPFQLTDDWKVIFRPVIPINSYKTVESIDIGFEGDGAFINDVDFKRKTGLGDIVLWTAFASNKMAKPPNVFGIGTTTMLDTASKKELGTGQNSVGPMALAFHIDDKWIYGTVVQYWRSFNENKSRNSVSLVDIQYVGRYRYSQNTNIGFAPNIRYNREASSGDRWTIPVGLGFDTMVKLGPLPTKIGLELFYYVKQADEFGPEWQLRFYFSPVIPAPRWTQKALF